MSLSGLLLGTGLCRAQARDAPLDLSPVEPTSSSSAAPANAAPETDAPGSAVPEDPSKVKALGPAAADCAIGPEQRGRVPVDRPFRSLAVAAKIGSGGAGFELATPLAHFMNLRTGAQFFDDTLEIKANGINADGDITLENVHLSVDIFPFPHSGFKVSPGMAVHNDNHVAGPIFVAGGSSFSLGDQDYTSDPDDPLSGFARVKFGGAVAPRFTLGWGNMLPRSGRRFGVSFEAGFQYISPPTVSLVLSGSGCTSQGCGPINQGDGAQNLQDEISRLQQDLRPLRFFPVVALGFSYKFGR